VVQVSLRKRGGNKRIVNVRGVIAGAMYVLSTGFQWATLSKGLPPRRSVNDHGLRWDCDSSLTLLHRAPWVYWREVTGCQASPGAAIIDCQSVKWAGLGRNGRTEVAGW